MRWKAERWMKVRHMPTAFRHDPVFVLRNGPKMLAHTFIPAPMADEGPGVARELRL